MINEGSFDYDATGILYAMSVSLAAPLCKKWQEKTVFAGSSRRLVPTQGRTASYKVRRMCSGVGISYFPVERLISFCKHDKGIEVRSCHAKIYGACSR